MNLAERIKEECTRLDDLAEQHDRQAVSEETLAVARRLADLLAHAARQVRNESLSEAERTSLAARLSSLRRGNDILNLSRAELIDLALSLASPGRSYDPT
jgi:uncharacterized protein YciW